MPQASPIYQRLIPALLVGMAVVMLLLIAVAVGVLLGVVPWH